MSAKNKKSLKLIIAAAIVTFSSVFLPTMSAYADIAGGGEEKAKNFLYAAAAYSCINHYNYNWERLGERLESSIEYGQKISSILKSDFPDDMGTTDHSKIFIGKWLGDENGYISCADALDNAAKGRVGFNSSNITADELSPSGLLYNVYNESSSSVNVLTCSYSIVNAEGSDYLLNDDMSIRMYDWPQGYFKGDDGNLVNRLNASPIEMKYTDAGYLGHTGGDSDIYEGIDNIIASAWDSSRNANEQCSAVVASGGMGVYPSAYSTGMTGLNGYVNVYNVSNDSDGIVVDERGAYESDANKATFMNTRRCLARNSVDACTQRGEYLNTFYGTSRQIATQGVIELADNTVSWRLFNLATNLKNAFFNGSTPNVYLNNNNDVKYIILGRYLFNGDGAMTGKNCGGTSIWEGDPNFANLSDDESWNISNSYVASIQAYKGNEKTNFRTKFQGEISDNSGEAPLPPFINDAASDNLGPTLRNCKTDIAAEFNNVTTGSSLPKGAVYGYINPVAINGDGTVPTPFNPGDPGTVETTDINCYTNAGALGWILCPIVESGGQFVEDIYDKFIEPQLVLDSGFFNRSNQGGEETYQAWQTFRNLANIAFVAVFLFVIFSQLTGFGIDNYGIKKLLPKMIIAAIIVNASYIICQIAIDAANIIGYGIKNIMGGIGTVPSDTEFAIREGGHTLASIGSNVGIAAIVAALTVPAVLGQGVGILITVFTALIGIVVAILTLFVVLAARKALSLVLVVISPLAFLCYMLPNTKKLFSKWLNALKGTLLAFPICAGMVFGGQAVSRIVMLTSGESSGTFFLTLIAAATAVAPIFLIPSVLKKSMGAISTVIDRASHGISRFGKERWRGSRVAKSWEKEGNLRRAAMQSDFDYRRAQRRIEAAKDRQPTSFAGRRALLNAHNTVASYDKELTQGYAYQMENASPDAAAVQLHNSTKGGKIDFNAASTALNRIGKLDQGRALEELEKFSDSDAFKNMGEEERNRFINMLNSQQGNTVAKAWAKVLGSNQENIKLEDAIKDPKYIAKQISGMSKDIVANTDKDVLRYMSGESYYKGGRTDFSGTLSNAFTNEQMSTALSSGAISGKQETYFSNVITRRDAGKVEDDLRLLTDEQVAVANDNGIAAAARKIGDDKVRDVLGQKVMDISDNEQLASKLSDRKKENFYKTSGGQKRLTTSIDGPIK